MTREEQIAQIERDRKKREAALLALLLAFGEAARLNIVRSIRVGADWPSVLRSVLLGDQRIDQRGGIPVLARVMADSHIAGYGRVGRLLGVQLPEAPAFDGLTETYKPAAARTLTRIADGLQSAVGNELAKVAEADRISADARAVGEAFKRYGWTPENAVAAAAESTATVLRAYAAGMHAGYKAPPAVPVMTGLRFTNPLDAVTTDICRKRTGTILPLDHPWWFRNWPPLHYGCRSVVLPLVRQFEFTADPPDFPPVAPGFGSYAGIL